MRTRPARHDDLPALFEIFGAAVGELYRRHAFEPPAPPSQVFIRLHAHMLDHDGDRFWVAQSGDRIVGFGAAIVRDDVWFLSALFVEPGHQAGGVGSELLRLAWEGGGGGIRRRLTVVDSFQPVSTALYSRAGLLPVTPLLSLAGQPAVAKTTDLEPVAVDDLALAELDARAYGFDRAPDHRFWQREAEATLWLEQDRPAAYSYRWPGGRIGPVAGESPVAAGAALAAELGRAQGRQVSLLVPGSAREALTAALAAGLRYAGPARPHPLDGIARARRSRSVRILAPLVVRPDDHTAPVDSTPERVVSFRPRTILVVLGVGLLVFAALALFYLAFAVITWIFIAAFLASALNPAVEWLERRGLRRGFAVGLVFLAAVLGLSGLGALLIPPLVDQVTQFIEAVPDLIEDMTAGRGPLGFLEREYGVVDRIRDAIDEQGAGGVLGLTGPAVGVLQGIVTGVIGIITVAFLTVFMLLEGPRTIDQLLELLPERQQARWRRVGANIYRTIGGYTSGNLLISLIAGVAALIVLLAIGSEYAVALALIVAILDLIPLAGATIAAILVSTVVFASEGWVRGVIVVVFFVVYQQLENQVLQPVIYGRTVQLSPLTVLIAVLIGAQLAGVLGALAAIPLAGSLLAIGREVLLYRREAMIETPPGSVLERADAET